MRVPNGAVAEAALRGAEVEMQHYLATETDPLDKAAGSKILVGIHGLMAGRQKEMDAAMGVSPAQKFIRRHQ